MQRSHRDFPDAPVELVLRGGSVLSLDDADTRGTAIAVQHGRIVRVAEDAEIVPMIGRRTRVVELDGRTVIPGINDSHLHAAWLGAIWPRTVFGSEGSENNIGTEAEAGASATALVTTEEERRAAILRAGELVAALGITSYTEPGIGPGEDAGATGCFSQAIFDSYVALEAERALTARVNVLALFGVLDGPSGVQVVTQGIRNLVRETQRSAWLRVAGVKIFADGIPPMLQAWTRRSYPDGTSGGLLVDGSDLADRAANLREMILTAHRLGLQVGVHATGDRSIETVISAVATGMAEDRVDLRHYIIHGDLVTAESLDRMARLGMGLNVQAGIAVRTAPWLAQALGADVAASAWPIADAMRAGVSLALSSDAPILPPDWRQGIADANTWLGEAAAGDEERRMLALLRAYTVEPARQDGAETWKGTLEPRKVADLCVLSANPLLVSPAELPAVDVDMTIVDGEVVFEREPALTA